MKDLKDLTYHELVDEATADIHSNLLKTGGEGMHHAVFKWLEIAIRWDKERKGQNV